MSKALDGLKWNSLRGPRYIRAEDHMANVGIYVGYYRARTPSTRTS